jgi:hypothetical protein
LLPGQLVLLQEERRLDQRVTFLARLAAYRQVVVERAPQVLAHLVALVRRAVVVLEHRAEPVHPQPAVRSAAAVAAVGQAVAAAEQTRSMR